jgi:hypothetical protein
MKANDSYYSVSSGFEEQMRDMQKMLEGHAFILFGFRNEGDGIRPVSFTFGHSPFVAEVVRGRTHDLAMKILNNVESTCAELEKERHVSGLSGKDN